MFNSTVMLSLAAVFVAGYGVGHWIVPLLQTDVHSDDIQILRTTQELQHDHWREEREELESMIKGHKTAEFQTIEEMKRLYTFLWHRQNFMGESFGFTQVMDTLKKLLTILDPELFIKHPAFPLNLTGGPVVVDTGRSAPNGGEPQQQMTYRLFIACPPLRHPYIVYEEENLRPGERPFWTDEDNHEQALADLQGNNPHAKIITQYIAD